MKMSKKMRLLLAIILSISSGSVVGITITTLSAPGLYTNPLYILSFAIGGTPIWIMLYLCIPVFVLALCTYIKTKQLSLLFCTLVPTSWLFIIFLWWASKPWRYYGVFPWNGFERQFLGLLPIALSTGWIFWKVITYNFDPNNPNAAER